MIQLNQKYNREDFINFLRDTFLQDFTRDVRPFNTEGFHTITKAVSLGQSKSLDLQVFEFEYSGSPNKRIALTKDAFQVMKQSATFRALGVFYSPESNDWRLSLLTANPERTEQGRVTVAYSNPKRYSFFLGTDAKVNTPTKFLINKGRVNDFEDLKSRFSLEVVNKEFYKQISEQFTKLVGGTVGNGNGKKTYPTILKLPSVGDQSQVSMEFAVRLIGRVIFCWFLREKKSEADIALMPKELLSYDAVKQTNDYYHEVLEPIFFELLNKPVKSRKDRYTKDTYSLIPYLNGGLFSPHDDDFFNYNEGKQTINHNTVVVPDEWIKGFFAILETYNFTIDENTGFDEELSIDPEMLGRIFENLLAEINPETGESVRKSTGSYYTPRPIVEYMVDESLLMYLCNQTNINEEKLKAVISYDLSDDLLYPLSEEEKELIINALEKVKILDPACGSGAFPIGALQKIVFILQQADPNGHLWFRKQLNRTSPELRRVIEREFEHKNFDYIRKLGVIRENIYGVDIQPIATEISRLRCFLTLIVDERVQDNMENRGIEPLPNLDFKFVTANSLIGLPTSREVNQMALFEDTEGIAELRELREMFFNASGFEREQLKLQFVQAQNNMFQRMFSEGRRGYAELTTKLSSWNPFSHKASLWFDPEWMFGIKDGFDIVIANPPYDVYEGHRKGEIDMIKQLSIYERAKGGKLNAYKLFLAKSAELLKEKGVLCEIFQNSFLADNSAKLIRKFFLEQQRIISINSFPERDDVHKRVFEAVKMSVCILLSLNEILPVYEFRLNAWKDKFMLGGKNILLTNKLLKQLDPETMSIPLANQFEIDLLKKLSDKKKLRDVINCYQGEINLTVHKKFLRNEQIGNSPLIKGAAIQKWLITENMSQGKIEYLDETGYQRINKGEKATHHKHERIVMQGITGVNENNRLKATILNKNIYCAHSVNYLITKAGVSPQYILALVNSRLLNWYFKIFSTNSNVNSYEVLNLPFMESNRKDELINIVNKIFSLTNSPDFFNNPKKIEEVKRLENQIDMVVYQIYGLTEYEVKIIEASN